MQYDKNIWIILRVDTQTKITGLGQVQIQHHYRESGSISSKPNSLWFLARWINDFPPTTTTKPSTPPSTNAMIKKSFILMACVCGFCVCVRFFVCVCGGWFLYAEYERNLCSSFVWLSGMFVHIYPPHYQHGTHAGRQERACARFDGALSLTCIRSCSGVYARISHVASIENCTHAMAKVSNIDPGASHVGRVRKLDAKNSIISDYR